MNNTLPLLMGSYQGLTTYISQSNASGQTAVVAPYLLLVGAVTGVFAFIANSCRAKKASVPQVDNFESNIIASDNPDRLAAAAILERLKTIKVTDTSFKGVSNDNKYVSKEQCDKASMAYVAMIGQMMVKKNKFGESLADLQALGEKTIKKNAGTCDQCAAAVLSEISKTEGWSSKVEWITTGGKNGISGGHSFLVIGRDEDSVLSDPSTWGGQAFMVDLWFQNLYNVDGLIDGGPEQTRIMTDYGTNVSVLNSWTPADFTHIEQAD